MAHLLERLRALERDIRVGVVGIGSIGKGMVLQAQLTPGIQCVAIADIVLERAVSCANWLGRDFQVVQTPAELHEVIQSGKLAVCAEGHLVAQCEFLDVFVEATSSISAGGKHAIAALQNHKHTVMMNYEADLLFGPALIKLANDNGCVYTVCDGDQPTVIKHLVEEMEFMGFQLVMAGNIKGFMDRYANPTSIIPEADKRNLDYRMCTSYTDGTKLCVEMAVVANGLGLKTAAPGMIGPKMRDIHDIFDHFDFERLWKEQQPLVDYVLGSTPKGGVFTIGYCDNKYQRDTLEWFPPEMGPGPFYLFYRPYHLGHFESMASVATVFLERRPVLQPRFGFQTNVFAYAKRDLRAGETLDGIGGYACYGVIENCNSGGSNDGIPICLAENVTLKSNVPKDGKILMTHVEFGSENFAYDLHVQATQTALKG